MKKLLCVLMLGMVFGDDSCDYDFDSDGICDSEDIDDDNDGVIDTEDSDENNPFVCLDNDSDSCDDCSNGFYDPTNDGGDYDADGICDAGDDDDDNDGVVDSEDCAPFYELASEIDCGGICGGDNSTADNCCGLPFYDDCTSDCYENPNTGECCPIWDVDECGVCNGDGTDCNNDGILDICEETYTYGYNAGYMNGLITGEIGTDENNDGLVDDFPLITILGSTALVLTQTFDSNYVDEGASCFSGETNLSQNVIVSGEVVNLSNIGTYVVSYNCQDNISGNQAITKHRTVIVQADYVDEDGDGYDDASYIAGLEEGILIGGQSGDSNGDGVLNILDIVYFVDVILNP
tara:strand:- start:230 stop:1273 length:1044 start_codon:yes stop_codon:yes gene_type:complete